MDLFGCSRIIKPICNTMKLTKAS